ncbi:uncharacterized protein LY79DRAFT_9313 [Colletotrichum navitas]|uniref:Uncharacterized protein n=1 Tax=Colletotrichum navitas TaxID=681940 RepID=A0AAD8VBC2_9PEZI|nr:uncharacterized protein LY79DRAFT_9313 [Colletotrichum navitas]KAK1600154.1 hypothetical protein LY79DRAFT_9313 [Colletotrichum navitas]
MPRCNVGPFGAANSTHPLGSGRSANGTRVGAPPPAFVHLGPAGSKGGQWSHEEATRRQESSREVRDESRVEGGKAQLRASDGPPLGLSRQASSYVGHGHGPSGSNSFGLTNLSDH